MTQSSFFPPTGEFLIGFLRGNSFIQSPLHQYWEGLKKHIIKQNDIFRTPIVFLQISCGHITFPDVLFGLLMKDVPIPITPAVDRLFYITHD
ncbi:hypothetical protein D3C86_1693850 [compost metagenome]